MKLRLFALMMDFYLRNMLLIESDPELDHTGDIDYLGKVGNKAFGI